MSDAVKILDAFTKILHQDSFVQLSSVLPSQDPGGGGRRRRVGSAPSANL